MGMGSTYGRLGYQTCTLYELKASTRRRASGFGEYSDLYPELPVENREALSASPALELSSWAKTASKAVLWRISVVIGRKPTPLSSTILVTTALVLVGTQPEIVKAIFDVITRRAEKLVQRLTWWATIVEVPRTKTCLVTC
ncbi:hypothetical protein BT69DRAFT_1297500 [Atractiella rhizophila]|nr:hypothetical protein BT69DRAFT_1297500 [Atractiella rhizophila]